MIRRVVAVALAAVAAPLWVAVAPAQAAGDQITVHIQPPSPLVGDALVVSGDVTDSTSGSPVPVPGVAVTIQRSDSAGPYAPAMAITDSNGAYSYSDPSPAVWKTLTYTVSLTSDSSQSGEKSVWVSRRTTALKIAAGRSIVRSGNDVRVTAHLGATATNRSVSIFAKPYHVDRSLVVKHSVDSNGNLSATPTVHRRTTYIARFGGDAEYKPARATVVVMARAVVSEHLWGGYATVGRYRLYHATAVPVLSARLQPQLDSVCLYFKAQRYFSGAWHSVAVRCFLTDQYGHARAEFRNVQLNSPYRVRARFRGGYAAKADAGPWYHLEFR